MTTTATTSPAETLEANAPATVSAQPVYSILALTLGIIGVLTSVFPLSVAAIVLGFLALQREPRARTMAIWGIVTGFLPVGLGILAVVTAGAILIPLGFLGLFGGFGAF